MIYLYEVINSWGSVCYRTEIESSFKDYCEKLDKQGVYYKTNIRGIYI